MHVWSLRSVSSGIVIAPSDWFIFSLSHLYIGSLSHFSIGSLSHLFIASMTQSFNDSMAQSLNGSILQGFNSSNSTRQRLYPEAPVAARGTRRPPAAALAVAANTARLIADSRAVSGSRGRLLGNATLSGYLPAPGV